MPKNVVRRDNIKTNYCKNNNIKLVRIIFNEVKSLEKIILSILKMEEKE